MVKKSQLLANKKSAGTFETLTNLVRLLVLIIVFSNVLALARAFITQNIDTFDAESSLLAARLSYSRDLNYFDKDTNRLYVGIVDIEKFKSESFRKLTTESIYYGSTNNEASARIELKDLESNAVYENYFNRELYDEKKVLVEAKLIGKGSAKKLSSKTYVLILDNGKLKRGVLNIEAILPNT